MPLPAPGPPGVLGLWQHSSHVCFVPTWLLPSVPVSSIGILRVSVSKFPASQQDTSHTGLGDTLRTSS